MKYKVEIHIEQIIEAVHEGEATEIAESLIWNNCYIYELEEEEEEE